MHHHLARLVSGIFVVLNLSTQNNGKSNITLRPNITPNVRTIMGYGQYKRNIAACHIDAH